MTPETAEIIRQQLIGIASTLSGLVVGFGVVFAALNRRDRVSETKAVDPIRIPRSPVVMAGRFGGMHGFWHNEAIA